MEKLSQLQQYILKKSLGYNKGGVDKNTFFKFYENIKNKPKDIASPAGYSRKENIIIKSLNRLIDRDLIVAFCKKTKHKIFINKILLTPTGRQIAKKLLGDQKALPIKYKKIKN
jgi:hypothetical protein